MAASFILGTRVSSAPPSMELARAEDRARFRVTTFAQGLSFPTSMVELADGSLLVAESVGTSLTTATSGRLIRLRDTNQDGMADGLPETLASGSELPGLVTSVRRHGNLVIALSARAGNQSITFWRTGMDPADPFSFAGRLRLGFPAGFEHTTYALCVRPVPGRQDVVDVLFNIGAAGNITATPKDMLVSLTGVGLDFAPSSVGGDSIHCVRVGNLDGMLSVSTPRQIASGLRNAAGMTLDSGQNLYLQDNGIDTPGNRGVSYSADEINFVSSAELDGPAIDFGFPGTFVSYSDGVLVNPSPSSRNPLAAFLPVSERRSEGAVEISMSPPGFGGEFSNGIFVAFYGMGGGGINNFENPVVFLNLDTGTHYHFVNNQVHGHPYGMLATADSLFVTDLSWTGSLSQTVNGVPANQAGVVYQVAAFPRAEANDPPVFSKGPDQVAADDSGETSIPQWATQISAGPQDEDAQTCTFIVTTTEPSLFAAGPVVEADGTLRFTPREQRSGLARVSVRLQDNGGKANGGVDTSVAQTFTIEVKIRPRVAGRRIFYNQSFFDGENPDLGPADDSAIATDKVALLPGGTSSFANVSNFVRGINGVMVDMVGLTGTPTAADFEFRVGRGPSPKSFMTAPAPSSVTVRAGAGVGGSDRVSIRWPDNIKNQWLEVRVNAGGQTGLAESDVFYFASIIGKVQMGFSAVTTTDALSTRAAIPAAIPWAITNLHDVNRDGSATSSDVLSIRASLTKPFAKVVPLTW